jgi:hypothetical protein
MRWVGSESLGDLGGYLGFVALVSVQILDSRDEVDCDLERFV